MTDANGNVLTQDQANTLDTVYRANSGLLAANPNLNPATMAQLNDNEANFFGGPAGSQSFAGGTLTNNGDGTATFKTAGGQTENFNSGMSLAQIVQGDSSGALDTAFGTSFNGDAGNTSDGGANSGQSPAPTMQDGGNMPTRSAGSTNGNSSGSSSGTTADTSSTSADGVNAQGILAQNNSGLNPGVVGANSPGGTTSLTQGSTTTGTAAVVNADGSITPGSTLAVTAGSPGTMTAAQMASAQENVSPDMTVAGNLDKYLGPGNPALQDLYNQAATQANQQFNQNGVLRSTMAEQVADQAMLGVANQDATADAQMYQNVAGTNTANLQQAFSTNAQLANTANADQLSSRAKGPGRNVHPRRS